MRALSLSDVTADAADHLPFDITGARTPARPHYPDGDFYHEAFDVLRGKARSCGAEVVLTGFGGDEMLALRASERQRPVVEPDLPPWLGEQARDALPLLDMGTAPVAPVSLATLMVSAARNPAYLRAGLWPIAPLGDPAMLTFGRSLPVAWRTGKALFRRRLTDSGFSLPVTQPTRPESFESVMSLALRTNGPRLLGEMLNYSPLVSEGYVSRAGIEQLYYHASKGGGLPPLVYDMLAVEIGVRSMCHQEMTV